MYMSGQQRIGDRKEHSLKVKVKLTLGAGNPRTGRLAPSIGLAAAEEDSFWVSLFDVGGGP